MSVPADARDLLDRLLAMTPDERWTEMNALEARPPAEGVDLALGLLEGVTTEHGPLVGMSALNLIARHGTPAHLPRLRAVRRRLPPMTGLRDWRQEHGFAVTMLETRERGDCDCRAYFACAAPPVAERFETLSETTGDWETIKEVRCRTCGTTSRVAEVYGYHYPIFRWG